MPSRRSYRIICGGTFYCDPRYIKVAYCVADVPAFHSRSYGLRFFHFISDLELLAGPTKELSNELRGKQQDSLL